MIEFSVPPEFDIGQLVGGFLAFCLFVFLIVGAIALVADGDRDPRP